MKITWKTCFLAGISAFLLFLCIHYWDAGMSLLLALLQAASPLLWGCVIAYVINILMSFLERRLPSLPGKPRLAKGKRALCLLGAYVFLALLVFLVLYLVLPQLTEALQLLLTQVPDALAQLVKELDLAPWLPELYAYLNHLDWEKLIQEGIDFFSTYGGQIAGSTLGVVTTVFGRVVKVFLSFIFSLYLLGDKERLQRQGLSLLNRYLPAGIKGKVLHALSVLDEKFHRFIVGQCTDALLLGGLCIVGMLIFRFPYAVTVGVLVGFTALIPVAGAYLGAAVGALLILTVSFQSSLLFLVFLVILQQLEGNLLYPRIVGGSLGLPSLWVLAAVVVGGGMAGVGGMLLGVPLAATAYELLKEDVYQKQKPTAFQKIEKKEEREEEIEAEK